MNVLLEKELAELGAKGITPNDLTADELFALVKGVERMQKPFRDANIELVGFPVILTDGTTLFNLTIGATVWLDEYAGEWWDTNTKTYFWAMVYALVHGRDRSAFEGMTDRETARSKIVKLALSIHVTEEELLEGIERAVHRLGGGEKTIARIEQDTDWSEIVRSLELHTGLPAEKWVWDKSADWCVKEYNKQRRYAEALKGGSSPRMKDELDFATSALARVRYTIMERLGKEA